MYKSATVAMLAAAMSFAAVPAYAGGWGGKGAQSYNSFNSTSAHNNYSSGLLNVSPSVNVGDVKVLSGILNNSPILSGNSILSGNNTGVGILGTGTGLLNNVIGNISKGKSRR